MEIKFNSNDETTEIPSMIIIAGAVFNENSKYYLRVFLYE